MKEKMTKQQCNGNLQAIGDALYAIGGKWKLRIIVGLTNGSKRFNELQKTVEGISAKVLSNELKELEMNGFVNRKIDTGTPVVVAYELTGYSHTLDKVLQTLSEWGTMHRQRIKKAMARERAAA